MPSVNKKDNQKNSQNKTSDTMRLNKFIANAGVCSRREADTLIKAGKIQVNGKTITEMGFQVGRNDDVRYEGKNLVSEKLVYILLNKPKGFITTVSDERNRRTVMDLIKNAGSERVVPVGRLDRNTTGLLLFTNDGDLTKKLTHPSYEVDKLYQVQTDKNFQEADIQKLLSGFELEDGFTKADEVSRVEKGKLNEIGILMHSGKNRIVRRMIEHLGYQVLRLDRVMFAHLTKKDLPRGKWRKLSEPEIGMLKRFIGKK